MTVKINFMGSEVRLRKAENGYLVNEAGDAYFVERNGQYYLVQRFKCCDIHGKYPWMALNRDGLQVVLDDLCPLCVQDRKTLALFKKAAIPPRFQGKQIARYVTKNDGQRFAKKVAVDFCKNIEKRIANGSNLIFAGSTGTGKTHLSASICSLAAKKGFNALFMTTREYIREIRDTWANGSKSREKDVLRKYADLDLLVLDEVGIQFGTESESIILFDLLNERYNNMKSTIILSNLPVAAQEGSDFKTIATYLGRRLYDRLCEDGRVVAFNWSSYRRKEVA